jgi:2-dehydropantoate 2-reductase
MNVVVLGAGALGSILAGHLARAGADVTLIARGARAQYVQHHGITITDLVDFTIPCPVVTDPARLSHADVCIVTVKTYDMTSALASMRHLAVSSVLSVQNGVVKNEQLATVFGREKVLGATAILSGEVLPAGPVRLTVNQGIAIGELPQGTSERVTRLVGALERAGIRAEATAQIQTAEWTKFVGWVGWTALAVLTRLESYKFLSDAATAVIGVRLMRETAALATQMGVPLEDNPPLNLVKTIAAVSEQQAVEILQETGAMMGSRAPTQRMSSLQDLERGRRLEVEETLGYVVTKAGEQGVPVPTVETCYRLISGLNRFV